MDQTSGVGETWWEYLNRVTDRASQVEIARAAGVDPASVSRWKLGKNTPSADRVIAVARHFGRNPVEALVVARYLEPREVDASIELAASAAALTDDELITAVRRRLELARGMVASGSPVSHD
ncbi:MULTISPECIES: helix-turn-helix domain-containing protein [unclassified Rhodococcus (in: high G+C Gram-positive bacteria)]|jgi:transcriptional regulator with XRE-family HTH domain|uniref:helix-turn-helix domain-containing protein n=1 Tax=unclassified Rhodococcus (in: high G+C Gram-positive bacteria) TaxID=192944 RepID=UPI0009E9119B|nr:MULTISPECIES: helix-turn-helix transcriptional regulator [unclassified Rhodococcus (in: high G+C Gram-positive bacteria)]MBY6678234.1 helix-turn-helix transcriptional regulator [Rhodococcus sp. BP-332]MBY6681596.1 helix-turn-helix transcriptional regulator [Rhodococcus sp. BP-316]MBY6683736.1 helix-turn-helix transcriptional regulator [Rhodococcus sp. BP-288]MBY6695149.1 helix-turn-helix transcriptional regulator [Rhodococcus sp. BP-188]MBY6697800.1 helix-turn-helix transcriptional regulato